MPAVAQQRNARGAVLSKLQGALTPLVVTNADRLIDLGQENLAVADLARAGRRDDGLHRLLHDGVGQHRLELDLGDEVDGVLTPAVELGVALLAAMATHLEHGHALDADFVQGVLDRFQLGGLNDGIDFDHEILRRLRFDDMMRLTRSPRTSNLPLRAESNPVPGPLLPRGRAGRPWRRRSSGSAAFRGWRAPRQSQRQWPGSTLDRVVHPLGRKPVRLLASL